MEKLYRLAIFIGLCLLPTACDRPPDTPGTLSQAGGSPCTNGVCSPGAGSSTQVWCPVQGFCYPASCHDGVWNLDETDVDCGGSCVRCEKNKVCYRPEDCLSLSCTNNKCDPYEMSEHCPDACTRYVKCKPGEYAQDFIGTDGLAYTGCAPLPVEVAPPECGPWNLACMIPPGGACYWDGECSASEAVKLGYALTQCIFDDMMQRFVLFQPPAPSDYALLPGGGFKQPNGDRRVGSCVPECGVWDMYFPCTFL